MPLVLRADVVEGKVYRGRKKRDDDEEARAFRDLQTILSYKNRKTCDCEAQVHDLLENCLNCGRLSCIAEGPGKCFTCGNLILEASQRDHFKKYIDMMQVTIPQTNNATTSGLKTRIIDNQYDQVTIQGKKHLRQEDRALLSENLGELQKQRHQRKLMMDLDIDNLEPGVAPIISVPKIDDYAGELQRLQLDDQPALFETKELLSDLVFKEYKKNYEFAYIEPKQAQPQELKQSNQPSKQKSAKVKTKKRRPR